MKLHVQRHKVIQPTGADYRLIPLTQNQNAIVDAADYAFLNQWNWTAAWSPGTQNYYVVRCERRIAIRMSRVILGLADDDPREAEHANRNTLDNRRENLRPATNTQNNANRRRLQKNNTTGYRGVRVMGDKWQAALFHKGRYIHLGTWPTPERAAQEYDEAARIVFEDFARTNF
jgi:hypothetical protein